MQDAVLSNSRDLYRTITEKIVAAIKDSPLTFKMPWHSPGVPAGMPTNAVTDAPYRGINVLSLWVDALTKDYPSGHWASYRQWQSVGAQVRKGEHGSLIVFYKRIEGAEGNQNPEDDRPRFFATSSVVFNAAQVEGWTQPLPLRSPEFETDKQVEAFISATGATIELGYPAARYRVDLDRIEMPSPHWFTGTATSAPIQSYYAILLHELTHWSGASHRLDRTFRNRFGDQAYAMEELTAELGAAFLCASLGIANEPRPDNAAYVASWLKVLEADARAIFTAASRAQQAAEYLSALAASKLGA
ncbi:MAG TPA: zincin-like metallopeptidase domain-containing protein [Rhizomicrobium sp.]|nr:zincin-like metallopeptidase domain-containing protein [Rhizomicrobium sp.]